MKNLSVTTFIHILFISAFLFLAIAFFLFYSWNQDRHRIDRFNRYQLVSIAFLSNLKLSPQANELSKLYEKLKLRPLKQKEKRVVKQKIQKYGEKLFSGGSSVGRVKVFRVDGHDYFYIQRLSYNLLLEDIQKKNFNVQIAIIAGILLTGILLLLYYAVLKKLYPLKRLHKQIQQFAKGDTQVRITYEYDDEIGKIATSFNSAIKHINQLSNSKNLFMRNLMHELKTPITKGRIAVEMMEDEETKKILIRAFERMNELIDELAEVERVTMRSFEPFMEQTSVKELTASALSLLMAPADSVDLQTDSANILTDKKLMTLVLKNLIDNAIKNSKEKSATIKSNKSNIEILSRSDPLKHPLEYYTEPFSQEKKSSSGFGLGLYIVNNILQKLNYEMHYRHKNGQNIFLLKRV